MFTIDMDEGVTRNVSHTGTAIDLDQVTFILRDCRITFRITSITATIDVTADGDLGKDIEH